MHNHDLKWSKMQQSSLVWIEGATAARKHTHKTLLFLILLRRLLPRLPEVAVSFSARFPLLHLPQLPRRLGLRLLFEYSSYHQSMRLKWLFTYLSNLFLHLLKPALPRGRTSNLLLLFLQLSQLPIPFRQKEGSQLASSFLLYIH